MYREVEHSGLSNKSACKRFVDWGLQYGVGRNCADLGPPIAVPINGEECWVQVQGFSIDFQRGQANEVVIRGVSTVIIQGGPVRVHEEWSVT